MILNLMTLTHKSITVFIGISEKKENKMYLQALFSHAA